MRLNEDEIQELRAVGTFYASQCRAIAGVAPTRHVVVWHLDNSTTRYDDDLAPIVFVDGDQIELVPAAAPSPSLAANFPT